jgi:hypothetical protein
MIARMNLQAVGMNVQPSGSDSDCDWEEGPVQDKNTIFPGYSMMIIIIIMIIMTVK